ncbi:Aldo/keto reductase [Alkalibacterium putridalgicola]|uniref:2,5-diketo-D-gluconic acid reductase n=1 Tax=Alkalibacterium putridalgicola TaxID=426703 RepID=A0A1H7TPT0_9LACT|nr:aldo/keto reductase [Alkalibacterium putridalgicola]GEK88178.1 2,5-diketo-D-gluconic acid reductase [Alkalibacterium putridalgicola]SEL86499.1 Aldo/keto reductase [Alkalibacterium putridalgicola]
MEHVRLNNGTTMPYLGTGTNTYGKENNDYNGDLNGDFSALESAIKMGYRLIDTAISYRNEAGVGKTVKESGIDRSEFYLTTKIPPQDDYVKDKQTVRKTLNQSLKNLQSDYIDLYLIHKPIEDEDKLKLTWEVLEEFVGKGKIRTIGVSNFTNEDLEKLGQFATIKPAVNQIKSNPVEWNNEWIKFMLDRDIRPQAWGPMKTTEQHRDVLAEIGERYGKTWAQVLLRYQTQRGIIVIPKSHDPKNQKANLESLDFLLSDDDMKKITQL